MQQLKLIIQVLPLLIDLIKTIENSIPESGAGKQKLQFIREFLQNVSPELLDIWPTIEKIISSVVSLFNTVGTFKKT